MEPRDTRHIERRSFLKGAAVVGATAWVAPTIQSMTAPAVAASSPCLDFVRFKFDVNDGQVTLDSGGGAEDCLPDGYPEARSIDQYLTTVAGSSWRFDVNGRIITISVGIAAGGKEAVVAIDGDVRDIDLSVKAGSSRGGTVECAADDGFGESGSPAVLRLPRRQISYVAGTLCLV